MPKISDEKIKKIKEDIIFCLFNSFPKALFTSEIAKEIARDEEFTKSLLFNLEKENLVLKIKMNSKGSRYNRRLRWTLPSTIYDSYKILSKKDKSYFLE